jgi:Na+-translocating ferredoxin:NAD+ oxidoreductase subunit G
MADMKNPSGLRVVFTLTLVTAIAAGLLAVVNAATIDQIMASRLAEKVDGVTAMLSDEAGQALFDNDPIGAGVALAVTQAGAAACPAEGDEVPAGCGDDAIVVYPATHNGSPVGYATETWSDEGYSGRISLLVVTDAQGSLIDYKVLVAKETPGLGTKMKDDGYRAQYKGAKLGSFGFAVKKDGGDVEAITSATITSRAATEAIERGLKAIQHVKEGTP